jgi:hypothetical protein
VVVELPKPPWYRRFGVVFLAANLVIAAVLVAVVVALWPPAAQQPGDPTTTAAMAPQSAQVGPAHAAPATVLSSSTTARREPDVLWQRQGRDAAVGERFEAVQRFGVRGRGSLLVTDGGRGRLIIESVCERWVVKAVAA